MPKGFEKNTDLLESESGSTHLNRDSLVKKDGMDLADVLDQGLEWTVINHCIGVDFPQLADFVQRALNVEHHIGEGETWDETLLGLSQAVVEHYKLNPSHAPDYKKIQRSALATKPPCI